jgi:hypothetical protein
MAGINSAKRFVLSSNSTAPNLLAKFFVSTSFQMEIATNWQLDRHDFTSEGVTLFSSPICKSITTTWGCNSFISCMICLKLTASPTSWISGSLLRRPAIAWRIISLSSAKSTLIIGRSYIISDLHRQLATRLTVFGVPLVSVPAYSNETNTLKNR